MEGSYTPQAGRVRARNVDDEHVGMRSERMDTGDKIIGGLLRTFFVLPQVDREEPALSQ